jgi:hypothetical protein
MPKGENPAKTKRFNVSTSPEIYGLLEEIAKSGYAARSVPTVAEELIRTGLDNLKPDGLLGKLLHERIAGIRIKGK